MEKVKLKDIKLFCLDMDGTIYLDDMLFDNVKETIEKLRKDSKIVFLTNNSSKSIKTYIEKLAKLGINISEDEMYSSGMATCEYLNKHHKNKSVYLVGTDALKKEFIEHGIVLDDQNPDIVVLGYDTTLTYQKLVRLTNFLNMGKYFIATHPDINCPAYPFSVPDVGSYLAMIELSTKRRPDIIIGKPNTIMGETIMNKFNLKANQIAMVGDRLVTDIAFGNNNNFTSILVLSGETTLDDYNNNDIKATYVFDSINDIIKNIEID